MAGHASHPALPAFLRQTRTELHNKFVDLEWQQRNRLAQGSNPPTRSTDPPSQWARLTGDAVTARNRYLNVEPWTQNRVKLQVSSGSNDYINASHIQLGKRKYIATQGPKDTSVNHFYRMVVSELKSPAVVIMLTQTHEAGKEKCFQYYPLSNEEGPLQIPQDDTFDDGFIGQVALSAMEDDSRSRSQLRNLVLTTKTANEEPQEKRIRHLLFSGWPDFLVPEGEDRAALIELVRLSAVLNRPASSDSTSQINGGSFDTDLASTDQDNPRIVHCSAGVGRSGTFIALDYLLSLMYAGQLDSLPTGRDPIVETVDSLRQQRMMMVQGESQFNFLYDVMREQYIARLQSLDTAAGAPQNGTL